MGRPERGRPAPGETAGYLEGLRRALELLRADGAPDPGLERALALAEGELARGAEADALTRLVRIEESLAARRPEAELTEIPRGLVGYVPRGARGRPLAPEEEPLAERRRLVLRLAGLRPLGEADRARVVDLLRRAEERLGAGDRAAAKRLTDEAHRIVEGAVRAPEERERPR